MKLRVSARRALHQSMQFILYFRLCHMLVLVIEAVVAGTSFEAAKRHHIPRLSRAIMLQEQSSSTCLRQ